MTHVETGAKIEVVEKSLADIESFTDNRDGTSTLTIVCASNRKVTFRIPKSKLAGININNIYNILITECAR